MVLNHKEKTEAEELAKKHPVVKIMLDELQSYEEDPAKVFYLEMTEIIKALSGEMRAIREGKVQDDGDGGLTNVEIMTNPKIFGMIKDMLTNSEKIFVGLKKGRYDIDPNAKKIQEGKKKAVVLS